MTAPDATLLDRIKALPQYLLPGHLLSRLMGLLTHWQWAPFKDRFIDWFIKRFQVEMAEAQEPDPHRYRHFNDFFTRSLRPDVRAVAEGAGVVASPVDGTVSQAGPITEGRLLQAKGCDYTVQALLGGDADEARRFAGGTFLTLYLSPRDYHRIHMPLDGRLERMVHVPGRLFSVSPATARAIPGLFTRNERVISHFHTDLGTMAVVKVGAIFVAGIETVWDGEITPPAGRVVRRWHYGPEGPVLERGAEMGRFNMGSTVILLFPPDTVEVESGLVPGATVRLGQRIAHHSRAAEMEKVARSRPG